MNQLLNSIVSIFVTTTAPNDTLVMTYQNRVDLNRYSGLWYEIARFENKFEKGCKNVTAEYRLKKNKSYKVINSCTSIKSGKKSFSAGVAYSTNKNNSKLKVSFFRPFYGKYWIIDLDSDYKFALVASPDRKYLWILSRNKTINDNIKNRLLKRAIKEKFDVNKLLWNIQDQK